MTTNEIAGLAYPGQAVSEAKRVAIRRALAMWDRRRLVVRLERSGRCERWRVNVSEHRPLRAA
jgi:hypothetical protein